MENSGLLNLITKLENFIEFVRNSGEQILNNNADVIEGMNRGQLWQGKKSDGRSLPNYSPVSVLKYGKPAGPMKLFDVGDYYRSITAQTQGYLLLDKNSVSLIVNFEATDWKAKMLERRFSNNILGLTSNNINALIDEIIIDRLEDEIGEFLS